MIKSRNVRIEFVDTLHVGFMLALLHGGVEGAVTASADVLIMCWSAFLRCVCKAEVHIMYL